MRDRVEADSNPECGAILRSPALGVIPEADAPLFSLRALIRLIKQRVCVMAWQPSAFSFFLPTAVAVS